MRILFAALAAAALCAPAAASAQSYPPAQQPAPIQSNPKGPHKTWTVCKRGSRPPRCDFKTIQKAVDKARAGDTIRVRNGVYREAVKVNGKKKRYLKLIGNPKRPEKVLLRARGNMQNGIFVNAANEVTVNGFMTRDYKSNGFFFTNLTGYTMDHLIARHTGVYGLYAFNSIGGRSQLGGRLRQRRRALHRADAPVASRCARSSPTSTPAAAPSASPARTCAT